MMTWVDAQSTRIHGGLGKETKSTDVGSPVIHLNSKPN